MSAICTAIPGCSWKTGETDLDICRALSVWHVYEDHHEIWTSFYGERPPRDPDVRIPHIRYYLSRN
jgi:hypothetical protein